jgi:hypothetical protein
MFVVEFEIGERVAVLWTVRTAPTQPAVQAIATAGLVRVRELAEAARHPDSHL